MVGAAGPGRSRIVCMAYSIGLLSCDSSAPQAAWLQVYLACTSDLDGGRPWWI